MKVTFTQDIVHGPGYGAIQVTDAPETAGAPTFSLQDTSTEEYLTDDGTWVGYKARITPVQHASVDSTLTLVIPPVVLAQLDAMQTYRFFLGDAPVGCPARLPQELPAGYVTASWSGTGAMPEMAAPAPVTPAAPEPEPTVEPEPELKPAPEPEIETPQEPEKPKAKTALIIGVIVLLALMAAGAFWFLGRDKGGNTAEPAAPTEQVAEPAAQPAATPDVGQAPAQSPQAAKGFLASARQHLAGSANPDESLSMARPLRVAGASEADSDGAFLLIEDAAEKGSPEAMFLLAQFYDPLCELPHGTIQPDLEQAHAWYRQAEDAGVEGATAALAALRAEVQQRADAGDRAAAALIQNW